MVTEKGYELNSGRVIPHTGIDLSLLTPDEFKELKETSVNMISQMQVKSAIAHIEKKIDELSIKLDNRKVECDEKVIVTIVDAWYEGLLEKYRDPDHELSKRFTARTIKDVKMFIKEVLLTSGSISKAIAAIVTLLSGFGLVVYIAIRLAVG